MRFKIIALWLIASACVLGIAHHANAADPDWQDQLTVALGGQPNAQSHAILTGWARSEGTVATHNQLATTKKMPGSTRLPGNPHGVQSFKTQSDGVEAMRWTLANYPSFAGAIAKGSLSDLIGQPEWKWKRYCGPGCNVQAYKNRLSEGYQQAIGAGKAPVASEPTLINNTQQSDLRPHRAQVTPSGPRMRYAIIGSLALVGYAGWTRAKRRQVIAIYTAVAVMLFADASSTRFSIPKVCTKFGSVIHDTGQAGLSPTTWAFPLLTAVIAGILIFGLAQRRNQTQQLVAQLLTLRNWVVRTSQILWSLKTYAAWGAVVTVASNLGAQTGQPGLVGGFIMAAIVGWIFFERIPSKEKVVA